MKKQIMIFLSILIMLSSAGDLFAQRQGGRTGQVRDGVRPVDRQGVRPRNGQIDRRRIEQRKAMADLKRLERLRMLKLLDLLNLDVKTEEKVIPHIRKHHKQMFELMKKHQQKIDQLANGLKKQKFSDDEIIKRIIEIDRLERKRQNKIGEFHLKAKEILTAEQLGKLYVFQARFGGEVLEKMRNFKKAQDERRKHENGN